MLNNSHRNKYFLFICVICAYAQEVSRPIVVNGDRVEYSTDAKEVTAQGNVLVVYQDSRLTCNKITVNTQTKEATAEGNVCLEDDKGIIEAEEARYNFDTKTGTILKAKIFTHPHFGKGEVIERIQENRFDVKDGYITTCNFDEPHYRLRSKKVGVYPQDKVKAKHATVQAGKIPLFYLPQYTHSLKDPFMHVRFIPGKKKEWGPYMLSAWRYNLTENIRGRIYLDYRQRLGLAEGFGMNYTTEDFGRGDYKFYYTQERARKLPQTSPAEFERYLVRWRHMWQMSPKMKATLEYYKVNDSRREALGTEYNFLKDYFYREFEKDSMPKSYLLISRLFPNASLSLLVQKRINPWYTHTNKVPDEKLPQISFDLPMYKLGRSPVYFKNQTQFSNLTNKNATPSNVDNDVVRFDTYNQLSLPTRLSIFRLSPFIGLRETFYTKDQFGDSLDPRTTFYSGLDLSTRFYRLFDFQTDFWSLDIDGLRHIIAPSIKYSYNHAPTISKDKLQVFDDIDPIERSNKLELELVNKLQTKRENKTVDFATLRMSTDYNLSEGETVGGGFSDFLFDLELIPYSWLRLESDITYSPEQDNFKTINFDAYADLGQERSFGLGHRYERKGGNVLTSELNWRFNPKWKLRVYERYQFSSSHRKGLEEHQYSIFRDLHCWTLGLTYNIRKDHGHSVYVVFKLKEFPELGIDLDQRYNKPKSDS